MQPDCNYKQDVTMWESMSQKSILYLIQIWRMDTEAECLITLSLKHMNFLNA